MIDKNIKKFLYTITTDKAINQEITIPDNIEILNIKSVIIGGSNCVVMLYKNDITIENNQLCYTNAFYMTCGTSSNAVDEKEYNNQTIKFTKAENMKMKILTNTNTQIYLLMEYREL